MQLVKGTRGFGFSLVAAAASELEVSFGDELQELKLILHTPLSYGLEPAENGCRWFNPFTPKSDQFQVSPAASPEIYNITQYEDLGFS